MQRILHFIKITFWGILILVACNRSYVGNPHRKSVAPRLATTGANNIRVEPANWWVGLKRNRVEVLVQYPQLSSFEVKLGKSKGVKLVKVEKANSPNYQFLTLEIDPKALAQVVPLVFTKGIEIVSYPFELRARGNKRLSGLDPSDVVYLIFPDRFANGDTTNDNVAGMLQGLERDSLVGRHGGDLQGIQNHLDYVQDLGMTAIWLNPELENDQKDASYHGYAVTDHYRVDRRFGTNQQLRNLIDECHKRGIKVVRDVVFNHIGDNHYWMKDLPYKDWISQWPSFTRTTYRAPTLVDPYASELDKQIFNDGWFDIRMPDLNQRNPHVANYLIQQAIWWVEYAGFDDFRIDTYTYSDQAFMSAWCKALTDQYPDMNMVGEIWEHAVPIQGYFADDQPMQRSTFDSNLPGVIDFQLCFAIQDALTREQGWTEGAAKIYYTLAQDYFYKDPFKNLTMLDNHDFTRFYTTINEDFNKYKSGMAFLLTMRGIPQIYYGTELLFTGNASPSHGNIRKDFPGGWAADTHNKFVRSGRTEIEEKAFQYARNLIRYRNTTPTLHNGKLMQFTPENGIYVYFRYDAAKTIMVILNTSNKAITLDTQRFLERMSGFSKAKNVETGEILPNISRLSLEKNSPMVLELI